MRNCFLAYITLYCLFLTVVSCHKSHLSCSLKSELACDLDYTPISCSLGTSGNPITAYDIIIIAGQSNTMSGIGLDSTIDISHPRIQQLGRHDGNDMKIIPAVEPLDHHFRVPNAIGFPMTFARNYVCEFLQLDRGVLLIPAALSDTGFKDQRWRPGDDLFEDALLRTNWVIDQFPDSKVKAILWHQGEKDVNQGDYAQQLDTMIQRFRKGIDQEENYTIPFILGGMVPFWVDRKIERQEQECIIKNTPNRVPFTAFANPRYPCTINKENYTVDKIHYDAASQRELGQRYFHAFLGLL